MKVAYREQVFRARRLEMVGQANAIAAEYKAQGYDLTLRQLFYQFVARNLIENTPTEYDRLGETLNEGRLAGYVDWDALVDITRETEIRSQWSSPDDMIYSAMASYHIDYWIGQPDRVEVWIEKDAMKGVVAELCRRWDVPLLSCRGYVSQSTMHESAQRIIDRYNDTSNHEDGQTTTIYYLGDHDPSGINMTEDIRGRLEMFCDYEGVPPPHIRRLGLNLGQVRGLNLPPNPVKKTDKRWKAYVARFGVEDSWELDALEPSFVNELIESRLDANIDHDLFDARKEREATEKGILQLCQQNWKDVAAFLKEKAS